MKSEGPLSGKTIGVLVASEFSDFQAQYIYFYASEFGGKVEFLKVRWGQMEIHQAQCQKQRRSWHVGHRPF